MASLFHWWREIGRAVRQLLTGFAHWTRASDALLVLLVLAVAALTLLYLGSWIARRLIAPGLGCTFQHLMPDQKRFLSAQFMGGLRRIDVPLLTSRQRWFEALVSLRYVVRREISLQSGPASCDPPATMPYEVTAAGWRELQRNLAHEKAMARRIGAGPAEH
jgi:hypothetical protein